MLPLENTLNIFTDGSSIGSPRRGGIGVIFVVIDSCGNEQVQEFQFSGYRNATNNEMELQACIIALREAVKANIPQHITKLLIQTDSLYIVDNYKKAMFEWPKTRWLNPHGRPVLNANLWKNLVKAIQKIRMPVEIKWVKAHSKSNYNKRADRLARASAKIPLHKPLSYVSVRRKSTNKSVDIGSVDMNAQRLTIRIITSERLPLQKLWKYKYEVISRNSPYRGHVDIIFSHDWLSSGHTYYVRLNSDTRNPRIEKVFREIKSDKQNE